MPIAFDAATAATTGNPGSGDTSLAFSHTCSGSDRVLYVFVHGRYHDNVTGVTYAGVSMTKIASVDDSWAGGEVLGTALYRLVAPATGPNNVVVTMSAARHATASAISLTGVHQTTPDRTPVTANGSAEHPSLSVTSAADEFVLDGATLLNNDNTSTLTVGAGQTQRTTNTAWNASGSGVRGSASTEPGASSVTMSWTADAVDYWTQIGVSVIPAVPAKVASFSDPLTHPTVINPALWDVVASGAGFSAAASAGGVVCTTGAGVGWASIHSKSFYDAISSRVFCELADDGNQGPNTLAAYFYLETDGGGPNAVQLRVRDNVLAALKSLAGVQTSLATVAWNPATMKYLSLRESAGSTYWEYSGDGVAWTLLHSVANSIALSRVVVILEAYSEDTASAITWRNVNVATPPTLHTVRSGQRW